MRPRMSRRRWMQLAGGIVIAGATGAACHFKRQRTVRLGLIGCGERAGMLAHGINGTRWFAIDGRIVAVCDVDRSRADRLAAEYAPSAFVTQDFRSVLSRDDVEAVVIATPDHWHVPLSIEALRAGKHVYCEKPLTLTIAEGRPLVAAVRASGLAFLVGTQQRSDERFQLACDLVRNGRLGELRRIEITLRENRVGGPFASRPIPPSLDWDRWLGPASRAEYCPERFLSFRSWFDYSGGTLTDWGAHHVDIAHWAMGLHDSGPIEISGEGVLPRVENGFDVPERYSVEMKYANGVTICVRTDSRAVGLLFVGDAGRIYVNRARLSGKPVEELRSNPLPPHAVRVGHRRSYWGGSKFAHLQHFLDCVVNGTPPISDVVSQHRSASACHLANIALRTARPVRWNPETESILNDPQAAAMLGRPTRPI